MQNTSSQSSTGLILSFGLSWVTLSLLIWGIGVSIGYPLGDTVGRSFFAEDGGYWAPTEQKIYLVNIVGSLIFGLAMGVGQGLLFQKYDLLRGWRWIAGTLGGFLVVALIASVLGLCYLSSLDGWIVIGGCWVKCLIIVLFHLIVSPSL